jgi:hypothetical protein
MVSEVSVYHGGKGAAERSNSHCGSEEANRETENACASKPLLSFLLLHLGPQPIEWLPTFRTGLPSLSYSFLEMPSQTHTEMCFTNLLEVSQSNQVDSQD